MINDWEQHEQIKDQEVH